MADNVESEDRVVAFLNYLLCNEAEGEKVENVLLEKFVELGEQKGFYFSKEHVKRVVKARISYGPSIRKWPWPKK